MSSRHVRGQLFGYRELPEESGLWGMLLPRPGHEVAAHGSDAQDVIDRLDEDRLVFANTERLGIRGFLLAFFLPFTLVQLIATIRFIPSVKLDSAFDLAFIAMLLAFTAIPCAAVFYCARAPIPPPVIISRRLRRIYAWPANGKGWISVDYDDVVPATFVHRMVTTSGSATTYVLTLCQLKAGTREIECSIVPAPAQSLPQSCGQLWEFIRRYMDGPAHALPPVRLVPPLTAAAWMARADREVLHNQVDDEHRVVRRVTSMYMVWWYGIVFYWAERARNWIERTAPRRPLPPELAEEDAPPLASDYRIIPYSPIELQAQAGTLPHMRRRWFICGVLSTVLWGTLFGLLAASAWVMR
ncbi:MAG: hypothetical protein HY856_15245 [Burkholderiales bacterium]|nr:hypothetical protein [Burkholderiales bacterium]